MASFYSPLSRTTTAAICSSSNVLVATFTQHLASHPTSAPLFATSSPLPSPLIFTSHPDQKGLMPLLALLPVSIHDALLTTYAPLLSPVCRLSSRIPQALSYSSDFSGPINDQGLCPYHQHFGVQARNCRHGCIHYATGNSVATLDYTGN